MKSFNKIVKELTKKNMTIATMESCTGGAVANAITSVSGASEVLKFSVVTYSNEYKIKMGIKKETLDKYTVYSKETAREMAYNICKYASSNIGIGITGKLNKADIHNPYNNDNEVYVCIYENNNYHDYKFTVVKNTRIQNKNYIIEEIVKKLETLLNISSK